MGSLFGICLRSSHGFGNEAGILSTASNSVLVQLRCVLSVKRSAGRSWRGAQSIAYVKPRCRLVIWVDQIVDACGVDVNSWKIPLPEGDSETSVDAYDELSAGSVV